MKFKFSGTKFTIHYISITSFLIEYLTRKVSPVGIHSNLLIISPCLTIMSVSQCLLHLIININYVTHTFCLSVQFFVINWGGLVKRSRIIMNVVLRIRIMEVVIRINIESLASFSSLADASFKIANFQFSSFCFVLFSSFGNSLLNSDSQRIFFATQLQSLLTCLMPAADRNVLTILQAFASAARGYTMISFSLGGTPNI